MTEELNRKANRLSLAYKTKYSEDRTLKDMLSRPKDFVEGAIEGIVNLLRQKAWRDGYIAGATETKAEAKVIIKKLMRYIPNWLSGLSTLPEDVKAEVDLFMKE